MITSVRLLPREQWAVLIPGHHPGYVSWETYKATAARLRANWRPPRGEGGGPRAIAALGGYREWPAWSGTAPVDLWARGAKWTFWGCT